MTLAVTEDFRMTAGGKQWRTFTATMDETNYSVTADQLGLNEIEAIIGVVNCMSFEAASCLVEMLDLSIAADGKALIWLSTVLGTQTVTVIGW